METEDKKIKSATDIADLVTLHEKGIIEFHTRYWKSAEENKRFRKGDHWSTEEKDDIADQGLIDYSLPLSASKLNVNISQQMANRNDWRCLGRGREDELNAEIKTALFKYVDDDNDFENLESDVYSDSVTKKYGVIKRYTDYSKTAKGRIVLKRIPYNQVIWDINCKDYNIPKYCNWIQEYEYFTRQQLIEMYPESKEAIEAIPQGNFTTAAGSDQDIVNWYRTERGLQECKRVTHYQRRYKTVYSQHFDDGTTDIYDPDIAENETSKSIGSEENRDINEKETEPAEGLYKRPDKSELSILPAQPGIRGRKLIKRIPRLVEYIEAIVFFKDTRTELDRYKLGREDLEGNFIESDLHCIHPYFSFFDDGEVICLMDYLKQPQKFLDRITMQIDKSMSKMIKSSYTVVKDLLEQETIDDWDNISTDLSTSGAIVLVKQHGALQPINSGVINPELFTMWQFIYKVLEDISGGRNNQGLKETSNESGVAVSQRKEAAYLLSYLYIDNLRRWKKTLGQGLLENIDEVYGDDKTSTFRILGDAMSKDILDILQSKDLYEPGELPYGYGYINLQNLERPLGETNVDIIISRAASSPQQKEMKFQQLMGWYTLQAQAGQPTPPLSLLFPYFDLDPTVKASIMKWEKEQQAKQQEMVNLEKQKLAFQGNMAIAKQATDAGKVILNKQPAQQTDTPMIQAPGTM